MNKLLVILSLVLTQTFCQTAFAQTLPNKTIPVHELYETAAQKFRSGDKDAAVVYYYAGQIRLRVIALMDKNPEATPAMLKKFQQQLGVPINQYAGSNIPKWVSSIKEAMTWDQKQSFNEISVVRIQKPATEIIAARNEIKVGLNSLITKLITEKDSIYAQRKANGLTITDPNYK